MSSGQQPPPRRVANVGSLLLTPQENESLFTFLGKKCVVSGRDPRRRRRRSLRAGEWEWAGGGGARRVGLPARPPPASGPASAPRTPLPRSAARVRAVRAAAAPDAASGAARERGVPVPEPRSARSAPWLPVQTLSRGGPDAGFLPERLGRPPRAPVPAPASPPAAGSPPGQGSQPWVGGGRKPRYE